MVEVAACLNHLLVDNKWMESVNNEKNTSLSAAYGLSAGMF